MGRAPCCDKANVKKGPWSPEEDAKLKSYIEQHGTGGNWIALPPKIGLKRCGKSCRLRWLNYLRPNIKHGGFSEEEERIICSLYITIGSRWSIIAAQLPGRTDNDIKNYWNTRLKKKLLGKQRKEQNHSRRVSGLKQETKRVSIRGNSVVDNGNHVYMPAELPNVMEPIPYSYQEPYNCKDRNSITKLLIKLHGRFAVDNYHQFVQEGKKNHQFPVHELTSISQEILEQPAYMSSRDHEFGENYQFNTSNGIGNDHGMEILQGGLGESSCTTDQAENYLPMPLPYDDNLQSVVEFLYGGHHDQEMMMLVGDSGCGVNNAIGNWGEVSSLICPPPPLLSSSNYELGLLQGLSNSTATTDQECSFTDLIMS